MLPYRDSQKMKENGNVCGHELELVIGKYSLRPLVGDLDNLALRKEWEPGICGFRKLGPSKDTSRVGGDNGTRRFAKMIHQQMWQPAPDCSESN
jgi:hypothetical protein